MKKKKLIIPMIIVIVVLAVCGGVGLNYYKNDKIVNIVSCKSIDKAGKPIDITNTFSVKDNTIYVSAKANSIFVRKAKMVWYKGNYTYDKNMIKSEKVIPVNSDGYFTSKLSVPEGLEKGMYVVVVGTSDGKHIERNLDIEVK